MVFRKRNAFVLLGISTIAALYLACGFISTFPEGTINRFRYAGPHAQSSQPRQTEQTHIITPYSDDSVRIYIGIVSLITLQLFACVG